MKQTLILDNLTCAHCAAKIEVKIAATEGYRQVSYNFATKKLQFETDNSHPGLKFKPSATALRTAYRF